MLFIEKPSRFSPYIQFSVSASMPKLSVLRVELERVQPGMSDFIARVASPKYDGEKNSGTVLSIRGTRSFSKFDTIKVLAETICKEMAKKKDATQDWSHIDVAYLTDMLYPTIKYFSVNMRVEKLSFSTEALA